MITTNIKESLKTAAAETLSGADDGLSSLAEQATADAVWEFVSYAATQDSHSRDQLDFVVEHSLQHDGYVGGWLNTENGLYYFDSTKLFPEDQLEEALQFGKENGQTSVYILSTGTDVYINYD